MPNIISFDCTNCKKSIKDNCCKSCYSGLKNNVFNSLTQHELDFLIAGKKQLRFEPGEVIVKQKDQANFGICIREGITKVCVKGPKDKSLIVKIGTRRDFLTGGSIYGEEHYEYSIVALTPVTVCFIDSATLKGLLSMNKVFASKLMRYHSIQLQYILNKISVLTQKYVPGRVADTILYLKNEVYKSNPFDVHLSRSELADLSNMTIESFVRTIMVFKKDGIIKLENKTFEVVGEDNLVRISRKG